MHRTGMMCDEPGQPIACLYPAQEASAVERMKPNHG